MDGMMGQPLQQPQAQPTPPQAPAPLPNNGTIPFGMQEMLQQMVQMRQQNNQQRDEALEAYMGAIRTAGRANDDMWQAAGQGMLAAPSGSSADIWGSAGKAISDRISLLREEEAKREVMATKTKYDDVVGRQKEDTALLRTVTPGKGATGYEFRKNADGTTTVFSKSTGMPVGTYGPQDIAKLNSTAQTLAKAAFEKGDFGTLDEAWAWAQQESIKHISQLNASQGNRTAPLGAPQGGLPKVESSTPSQPPVGELGLPPGTHIANTETVRMMKQHMEQLAASGDYAGAMELQKALLEGNMLPQQPPAAAGSAGLTMPKKDIVREKTRESSSVGGSEIYQKSFDENVLKPAAAFANTGKIMQDFNNLARMNDALKNGKLKEFMAGEAGQWALSALPENSQLRRGIANAQEANKLTESMVQQILQAAKGVQTEGDAQRARSQVTSIGADPDANKYLETFIMETARQLKLREKAGREHKNATGSWEGYDDAWMSSPIMTQARGSVKKIGNTWVGVTQYIQKFKDKNPGATDADAIARWNQVN